MRQQHLAELLPHRYNLSLAETAPLGVGVSVTTDLARGAAKFITGDYGEGTKEFLANLPGARLWFIKDQVNDMSRAIAGRMD